MFLGSVFADKNFILKGERSQDRLLYSIEKTGDPIKNVYLPIILLIALKYAQDLFIHFMSCKAHKNLI